MSRSTRGFLLTALAIVAIAILPMVVALVTGAVAAVLGCPIDEVSVHSCPLLGLDLGYLLYALGVSAWFVMFTFPLGVIALLVLLVIWIIAALTRRLGRMDAPDTKA